MTISTNAQNVMLDHSKAKVELYKRYLSIYLNILSKADFVSKVFLYDLFAGEGKYANNELGSPIEAMNSIKNHYFANGKKIKDIKFHINDSGISKIEPGKKKIDRIGELISEIFTPPNVKVVLTAFEYSDIYPEVEKEVRSLKAHEKALVFIDPFGYKEIKPIELRSLFLSKSVEILLFLPISFMHRFSEKALNDEDYTEGKALELFLRDLFMNKPPQITSVHKYIFDLKCQFQNFLGSKYVDSFSIQRDKSNVFSLFFFTHSKLGFQKMIEAKWSVDNERGKGFRLSNDLPLFSEVEIDDYETKLKNFIFESDGKTNEEIRDYGYENSFLPKHSNHILKKLENEIEIVSIDGKDIKGTYLTNKSRQVLIKRKI